VLAVKKEKSGRRRRWPAAEKGRGRVEEDQADLLQLLGEVARGLSLFGGASSEVRRCGCSVVV
jgi:hypothetical protein